MLFLVFSFVLILYFFQFYFSCDPTSLTNFLTVNSKEVVNGKCFQLSHRAISEANNKIIQSISYVLWSFNFKEVRYIYLIYNPSGQHVLSFYNLAIFKKIFLNFLQEEFLQLSLISQWISNNIEITEKNLTKPIFLR